MAYKMIKVEYDGRSYGKKYYICDSVDDINFLPTTIKLGREQQHDTVSDDMCGVGSVATVPEADKKYILNASNVWVIDNSSENGNGVDGKSAYEIAVNNGFEGTEAEWLVSLKGEKGDTGAKGSTGAAGNEGRGVLSAEITYRAHTSGTTTPTAGWSSTVPTVTAGQYLWTRTVFTYTDGTDTTVYSVGCMGEKGDTGETGKGVKSISLTTTEGVVTGGTVTFSDDSTSDIAITAL